MSNGEDKCMDRTLDELILVLEDLMTTLEQMMKTIPEAEASSE